MKFQRGALEVNIINARLRRHEVYLINTIAERLRHIAVLPDTRREKNKHADVL